MRTPTVSLRFFTTRSFFIFFALVFLLVGVVVAYLISATARMGSDYALEDLENKIAAVRTQTDSLQIELSETNSLQQILERSSSLSYTQITKVHYIERSGSAPFAAR